MEYEALFINRYGGINIEERELREVLYCLYNNGLAVYPSKDIRELRASARHLILQAKEIELPQDLGTVQSEAAARFNRYLLDVLHKREHSNFSVPPKLHIAAHKLTQMYFRSADHPQDPRMTFEVTGGIQNAIANIHRAAEPCDLTPLAVIGLVTERFLSTVLVPPSE